MNLSIRNGFVLSVVIQAGFLVLLGGVAGIFFQRAMDSAQAVAQARSLQAAMHQSLRGAGEILLTEGSSASKELARNGVAAVDRFLIAQAGRAGQGTVGEGQSIIPKDRWAGVRDPLLQMLERKKVSMDDPDLLIQFGKMAGIGAELSALADNAVSQAEQEQVRDTRIMFGLIGVGISLWLLVTLAVSRLLYMSVGRPLKEAVLAAERIGKGDIDTPVPTGHRHEMGRLLQALDAMRESLLGVISVVQRGSEAVATASAEIASGNLDLSHRTETQAQALEETSASMTELGSTVAQNADHARQADELAQSASNVASRGGEVVGQVVSTMKGINDASRKIADIIGVIDGIAFQTNILALNAAVEAARAGEQGRGFAVVASEVRSLAGRSADAAREIKNLISASVERVADGTALVDQAGATMQEVVNAIQQVTLIVGEISKASMAQQVGVGQVGSAVTGLEHSIQQNAALVEQMSAAADKLRGQARELVDSVGVFQTRS